MADPAGGSIRIGELARRVGLTVDVLRAWERRYGIPKPRRSSGGFRLYTEDDEQALRAMVGLVSGGMAPAQAAQAVVDRQRDALPAIPAGGEPANALAMRLQAALDAFDDAAAQRVLDQLLATLSVDAVLEEVVLPYLHRLGDRWSAGEISIAQEHFASQVLRGRMMALARGWGAGSGPLVVLAALPGEQHDLGLIAFGLALAGRGWQVRFLGADTPLEAVAQVVDEHAPAWVVLSASTPERITAVGSDLAALARRTPVLLAGHGADPRLARSLGCEYLLDGPVAAAQALVQRIVPGAASR